MSSTNNDEGMKMNVFSPSSAGCRPFHRTSERGAALIITLSLLVLVTALVVALLITATNERTESSAASNQGDAQHLAGSVVNLVKSTITQATAGYEADLVTGTLDKTKPISWASQPGLIRTWKQDGQPDRSFRLYSSGNLVTTGTLDLAAENTQMNGWKSAPPSSLGSSYNALWCDLNAPVLNESSQRIYPIITPPKDSNSGSTAMDSDFGIPTATLAGGIQTGVQGFSIVLPPGYTTGTTASAVNNPAPMPVKWLYVLKDGSHVTPAGSGTTATIKGATGPTKANPIIARIAYWTDDETCKVNVNTASEGYFWDTPKADGIGERNLAINLPVRSEYQRIAGHPFMVSLSSVLSEFSSGSASDYQSIYSATPRTQWGGSQNGQQPFPPPIYANYLGQNAKTGLPADWASRSGNMAPLILKTDRLYDSMDEFLFNPTRGLNIGYDPTTGRTPAGMGFFLTTDSKAPETTLFEQPRVSIWPITWPAAADTTKDWTVPGTNPCMTAEEKLLAYCGTVNGGRYFYQRQNSQSATDDFTNIKRNQAIYDLLRDCMGRIIPGFGNSLRSKFGDDSEQLLTSCFDYVRSGVNLGNQAAVPPYYYAIPNYRGVSFTDHSGEKSGGGSVVPIKITTHGPPTHGLGQMPTVSEVGLQFLATARDLPVPTDPDPAKRNYINFGDLNLSGSQASGAAAAAGTANYPIGARTTQIQMIMLADFVRSMSGYIPLNAACAMVIKGNSFQVNGTPINFPSTSGLTNYCALYRNTQLWALSEMGPWMGGCWMFGQDEYLTGSYAKILGRSGYSPSQYPFYGDPVAVDPNATTFDFTGSVVTLEIWSVDLTNSNRTLKDKLQTMTLDFTALNGNFPMPYAPRYAKVATGGGVQVPGPPLYPTLPVPVPVSEIADVRYFFSAPPLPGQPQTLDMRDLYTRIKKCTEDKPPTFGMASNNTVMFPFYNGNGFMQSPDTLISLRLDPNGPTAGDLRLLSMTETVPSTWFAPHPKTLAILNLPATTLTLKTDRSAHSMHFWGGTTAGLTYAPVGPNDGTDYLNASLIAGPMQGVINVSNTPGIGVAVSGTNPVAGDWNNALGSLSDGATIPKPVDTFLTLTQNFDGTSQTPFFSEYNGELVGSSAYFSPVRQIPSPVVFGSLPAQVLAGKPWRNLLFNPNPQQGVSHPGFASPPDHLLLDLFWMPSVEPYAISEPLCTSGKININQQIAPFSYLERDTALYALLKSVKLTAIPKSEALKYKLPDGEYGAVTGYNFSNPGDFRRSLKLPATVQGFKDRWNSQGPFRSASQVCEMFLVPDGVSGVTDVATTAGWWKNGNGNAAASPVLTGANSRQQPYSHLYQLVTTKSNTFTVHLRVQALKQVRSGRSTDADWQNWVEARDQVVSEYRGSSTIERYVDPNDSAIPDFTLQANYAKSLAPYYKWRTVAEHQFVP